MVQDPSFIMEHTDEPVFHDEELAASSTGDRQLVFTGTPPDASAPGTVFSRNR